MTIKGIQVLKPRTTFQYFSAFEKKILTFFRFPEKFFRFFNSPFGIPDFIYLLKLNNNNGEAAHFVYVTVKFEL